jgi:DNA polymerase-3 subunit epsilon
LPPTVTPSAASPPRRALRREPWRRAPFAALDFETTGLDYERDAVISFGVVPVLGGRVVLGASAHQLVAPDVAASPASMKVHGIVPRDLERAASPSEARERLAAELSGRFVLAWYAGVELAFLRRMFGGRARSWRRRTIDVRPLVLELEGEDPRSRRGLSATAERYGVPVANPHDALDDALVTAQLFLVAASRLESRGLGSVRSLLRISSRGARAAST